MDPLEQLLDWAQMQGIQLHGIKPQRIPGRGIGVVTTRRVKKDEVLLSVPTAALRTLTTVPKSISRKLPADMTVHGLLAADLALETTTTPSPSRPLPKFHPWTNTLPTPSDIRTSMPLLWPPALQALLPPPAAALLSTQLSKFTTDWTAVTTAFPTLPRPAFAHAWLLVNSRTFYHTTPRTERLPRPDRMALQPLADLFNHAAAGCAVSFDASGFAITADAAHPPGAELAICYGAHANDFLLVEYGFVPAAGTNRWDGVRVDGALETALRRARPAVGERVAAAGFWGNYVVDGTTHGVCYRTEVAARALVMRPREWARFVAGEVDGEDTQGAVDGVLARVLGECRDEARERLASVEALTVGEEGQREVLRRRWEQIGDILDAAIQGLGT